MEFWIEMFLTELMNTFEWANIYNQTKDNTELLRAGEHLQKAWVHLWSAKKYLEEKEWHEWENIYWDFYKDLNEYVSE